MRKMHLHGVNRIMLSKSWRHLCPLSAPALLDGSVERAEVTDLYPWMEYQFRIIATNEYGSGEASIPSLKIKTWDARKNRMFTSYSKNQRRYVILKLSHSGEI